MQWYKKIFTIWKTNLKMKYIFFIAFLCAGVSYAQAISVMDWIPARLEKFFWRILPGPAQDIVGVGISEMNSIINIGENAFEKTFLIFPGTEWCGAGDRAKDESDLGYLKGTDSCCRTHDMCQNSIAAGEMSIKYNLTNDRSYTLSECSCDEEFFHCLQNQNGMASKKIGIIYFDILRIPCFDLVPPILGCAQRSWGRCVKYDYGTGEETWQFMDNPPFPLL